MSAIANTLKLLIAGTMLHTLLFAAAATAHAQTAGAIAQGFTADTGKGKIVAGALVSFKAGSGSVELATVASAERLVGVADQEALVAISGNKQEAQIVLGGTTSVLVSDINGSIQAGDKITASPIGGVGMRATGNGRIVGVAQNDFDASAAETRTIQDSHGKEHTVKLGRIFLQVGLSNYQAPGSNFLPPFIQNLANSIAGRQVSIVRVLFCSILLLLSFASLIILISSSVRSAMVSIGRNPLASGDIRKSLYQVGAVTVAAWGGALVACYLILTV
ncbi:MAG TPA: hypothetical protein VLI54_00730 [Bacillota bacterium]|nr:hypothetical protein [Bacillota bacterium]